MLALVLGQAAQAQARHASQLLAWLVGVGVLAAITLGPGAAMLRVTEAYAGGSAVVAAVLAALLFARHRPAGGHPPRTGRGACR